MKAQKVIHQSKQQVPSANEEKSFIFVKSEYKHIKIDFSDIQFIESMKDYLKIYIKSQPKPILTLMSLTAMEKELPNHFMRIHRSYIINLNAIESIERMRVYIRNEPLPVSESYKNEFNQRIKHYFAG